MSQLSFIGIFSISWLRSSSFIARYWFDFRFDILLDTVDVKNYKTVMDMLEDG